MHKNEYVNFVSTINFLNGIYIILMK